MSDHTPSSPIVPHDAALEFLRRGWAPVPIPFRTKAPVISGWQKLRITSAEAPTRFAKRQANIGVLLGEPSGGLVDIDLDCGEAVDLAPQFLPPTEAIFGRSGKPNSHWLYTVPGAKAKRFDTPDDGMLVEIRSTGGQTVFPPSVHVGGERIAWTRFGEAARVSMTELTVSVARLAAAALLARHWPKNNRHNAALALSGALLGRGCEVERVVDFVRAVAEAAGDNEVRDRVQAVRDTHRRIEAGEAVTGLRQLTELVGTDITKALAQWLGLHASEERLTNTQCTDAANGERLVRAYGQDIRFAFYRKKWLVWDGKRWATDEIALIERYATRVARDILSEAAKAGTPEEEKVLKSWARQSQMGSRIDAMIKAARSIVPIKADEIDRDQFLLNASNGTIDLRTGKLRAHDRADYITKISPTSFDANATAPRWLAFLDKITDGNGELANYLQRVVGYGATGDTSEQCAFLLHGSGANGKSTFIETALSALGEDYARPMEFRALLHRERSDSVRNDLAALHGARLVTAVEVAPEKRLDEPLLKQLTGSDTITARSLYAEYFNFIPTFKLLLAANHRPVIRGIDEGIWRRIRLVPFEVTIPPTERDRKLRTVLRDELEGVLAWIVAGALKWSQSGLEEPSAVTRATAAYREESDTLADFLASCTEERRGARLPVAALYFAYESWANEGGSIAWTRETFGKAIVERGHRPKPHNVGGKTTRLYSNFALNSEGHRLAAATRHRRGIPDDPTASF